ncbi:MAG: hypothetical protein WD738_21175 [Pirellulales bacterium]
MTVCIAAICQISIEQQIVIGAADHKVTAGDIQFEPDTQKIYYFNSHGGIIGLMAGDLAAQKEICDCVWYRQPQSVREAVRFYCRELGEFNKRQAEQIVLAPLGLTMESFLQDQQRMSPDFAEQIRYDMRQERAEIETIICGVDVSRVAQIYTVEPDGRSSCNNSTGFTAIGDGANHALSQFMFARYTPRTLMSHALMLTYTAKKRAEVAPGVGRDTDLFFVADRGFSNFHEPIVGGLEDAFQRMRQAQETAMEESNRFLDDFMAQLVAKGGEQAQAPEQPPPPPPVEEGKTPPKRKPRKRK